MSEHSVPSSLVEDKGYCECVPNDSLVFRVVDSGKFARWNFSLGWSPEGKPGRREYGGPEVSELFGWLNEQAVCITAWVAPKAPVVEVSVGDEISVEGVGTFRVVLQGWEKRPGVEVV